MISFFNQMIVALIPDGWYRLWFIKTQQQMRSAWFPASIEPELPFYSKIWGDFDNFTSVFNRLRKTTCLFRLTATAVANERYYLKYGKYPGRLAELVPEFLSPIPIDSYSRKEFAYIQAGVRSKRPVIYSFGENRTDDGGFQFRKPDRGDIVWQYKLPKGFTIESYQKNEMP